MIKEQDKAEFVGQIIDIFEDFLEEKGVMLDNTDRDEAINDGEDPETLAIIYGTDYGDLQDQIEDTLRRWKLLDE